MDCWIDTYICACDRFLQIGLSHAVSVLSLHLRRLRQLRVSRSLSEMGRCLLCLGRHLAKLAISEILAGIRLLMLRGSRGTLGSFGLASGLQGIRSQWAAPRSVLLLLVVNTCRGGLHRFVGEGLRVLRVLVQGCADHPLLLV